MRITMKILTRVFSPFRHVVVCSAFVGTIVLGGAWLWSDCSNGCFQAECVKVNATVSYKVSLASCVKGWYRTPGGSPGANFVCSEYAPTQWMIKSVCEDSNPECPANAVGEATNCAVNCRPVVNSATSDGKFARRFCQPIDPPPSGPQG